MGAGADDEGGASAAFSGPGLRETAGGCGGSGCATGGAADSAGCSAVSSISPITAPIGTSLPAATRTFSFPLTSASRSEDAFSVSIVTIASPLRTQLPSGFSQLATVLSVMDSPKGGIVI